MESIFDILMRTADDGAASLRSLDKALEIARTIEDEARAEADHLMGLRSMLTDVSALASNSKAISAARDRRVRTAALLQQLERRLASKEHRAACR